MLLTTAPTDPSTQTLASQSVNRIPLRTVWVISICALALSLLTAIAAADVETTYLKNYPYFCEPIGYFMRDIEVFFDLQQRGPVACLATQLSENGRHPLRQIPAVLFAPNLLTDVNGHLVTASALLFSFLILLGLTVYQRSRSVSYALSAMCLLCAVPGNFQPTYGFGAYFLDYPAALALGAAAFSLINYTFTAHRRWLIAFGVFASITTLSRYTAAFYLICFAGPALLPILYANWRQKERSNKTLIRDLSVLIASCAPGIIFLIAHVKQNVTHYTTFGYALNAPIAKCFANICNFAYEFVGLPIGVTLIVILALNLARATALFRQPAGLRAVLSGLWFPLSILLFICFVVRVADARCHLVYIVPAIFAAAFATPSFVTSEKKGVIAAVSLIAISIFTAAYSYHSNKCMAQTPPLSVAKQKQVDRFIGNYLTKVKAKNFVDFTDNNYAPNMESFYGSNAHWYPSTNSQFTIHKTYYPVFFPGKNPEQVSQLIYSDAAKNADVILVFENVGDIQKQPLLADPFSRSVSRFVSEHVRNNPTWRYVSTMPGPFGPVTVYENGRR